jgi:transposase
VSETAKRRLRILKEGKGNVRMTCRKHGISPTTFYEWKRRYAEGSIPALEPRSSAPKKHFRKVTRKIEKAIVEWVTEYGMTDFKSFVQHLREDGIPLDLDTSLRIGISPTTLSIILKRNHLDYRVLQKEWKEFLADYRRAERVEKFAIERSLVKPL